MKFTPILVGLALTLAACSTPFSGSGLTKDGTPITGNRVVHTGHSEDVSFTSLDGWSCSGTVNLYQMFYDGRTSEAFPVKCSDGRTGNVMVAFPFLDRSRLRPGDVSYTFKLSDGTTGLFRI
ncbi:hypothetical protein [Arenibacterium sp. LLYu02]|uniref:hypothetical protein n=1 Tax=Arenibacterium sp. LLYu02 TaxID=3404132 RepID=UPI003B213878